MKETSQKRLAIFDFCETLIGFQTANAFVEHVLQRKEYMVRYFFYRIYQFVNRIKLLSGIYMLFKGKGGSKRIPALFLSNINRDELEKYAKEYYDKMLFPAIIWPVVEELNKQKETRDIVIVSGGYTIYINIFAEQFGVSHVVANRLTFKNEKCTGRFGIDVMDEQKIVELEKVYGSHGIDYKNSFFYTDSKSDLPLLEKVGHKVVVSKTNHHPWIDSIHNCREIIWN